MRVVFVGAGHATLVALADLARRPAPGCDLLVVSAQRHAAYSGMVPGWVEGIYKSDDLLIDVAGVAARAGATLVLARMIAIDPDQRSIRLENGAEIRFDFAVLNLGSRPAPPPLADPDTTVLPPKPFQTFLERLPPVLEELAAAPSPSVAVAGGGVAGVELTFALRCRLDCMRQAFDSAAIPAVIRIVEAGPEPLAGTPNRFRRKALARLREVQIEVVSNATVSGVLTGALLTKAGLRYPADAVVWAVGSRPSMDLSSSGLALDADGWIATDRCFRSTSHPHVLAVGDAGTVIADPRPKAGVFSVRQGHPLANIVRRIARRQRVRPVRRERRALILLSEGNRRALGTRNGLVAEGHWVWRWKDRIDRRWVRRFKR